MTLQSGRYQDVLKTSGMDLRLLEALRARDVAGVRAVLEGLAGGGMGAAGGLEPGGCTALGLAAQMGERKIVDMLLKKGCDVNEADFYGQTPLHYASENGHTEVVKMLISAGADVDWMDVHKEGLSSLHVAACKGHTDVARLLIQAKCDVNAKDISGVSVLHCAVANGHQPVAELLLQAKAHVNIKGTTSGRTPIFLACETGQVDMVKLLVTHRAKLNVRDHYGLTPLCAVCLQNHTALAQCLVDSGSKINLPDNKLNYPLHYATRNGNLDIMEMLLLAGSELNKTNKHGASPLHTAIQANHTQAVFKLLQNGADANLCVSDDMDTPLHTAVRSYNEVADFEQLLGNLVDHNCDFDLRGHFKVETPLFLALHLGKADFALSLLQHGASPNVECPFDVTILYKACQRGLTEVVFTLLHTEIQWSRELWLHSDIHTSGINPKLLVGYAENIPMVLLKHQDLFSLIQHFKSTPASLGQMCRCIIRRILGRGLHRKVLSLELPRKLKDYVMLKIL